MANNMKDTFMDAAFLAEQKAKLLAEKQRIEDEIALRSTPKESAHEKERHRVKYEDYGDTVEDNAAEVAQYDVQLHVERQLEEQLGRVNAALKRLEDGTYGVDEETGKEISEERLRANPTATTEVRHHKE